MFVTIYEHQSREMRVRHLCLTTKLFERSLQLSHVRNTDLKATSVSRTIVLTPIQLHANTTNAFSGQMQMQWKVNCIWLWLFPSIWLHLPLNASQITIAIVFTPWRFVCAFEIQLPRIWPSSLVLTRMKTTPKPFWMEEVFLNAPRLQPGSKTRLTLVMGFRNPF
jgi:hypothetical protein